MPNENIEIVRQACEARNRGDVDAAMSDFHPEAELDWSEGRAAAGGVIEDVVQGRPRIREALREQFDVWERILWDPEELLELGADQVLEVSSVRFQGRDGIELGDRGVLLWTFARGKVVRVKFFPSKERALEVLQQG